MQIRRTGKVDNTGKEHMHAGAGANDDDCAYREQEEEWCAAAVCVGYIQHEINFFVILGVNSIVA